MKLMFSQDLVLRAHMQMYTRTESSPTLCLGDAPAAQECPSALL